MAYDDYRRSGRDWDDRSGEDRRWGYERDRHWSDGRPAEERDFDRNRGGRAERGRDRDTW